MRPNFLPVVMVLSTFPAMAVNGTIVAKVMFPLMLLVFVLLLRKQMCATARYWRFWMAIALFNAAILFTPTLRESKESGLIMLFLIVFFFVFSWWYMQSRTVAKVLRIWRVVR